jgi:hypothetical protein
LNQQQHRFLTEDVTKNPETDTSASSKMVKGAGQVYAGSKIKMASAVDFSTSYSKVWSPAGKSFVKI